MPANGDNDCEEQAAGADAGTPVAIIRGLSGAPDGACAVLPTCWQERSASG